MISDWVAFQNYIYKRSYLSFFNYKKVDRDLTVILIQFLGTLADVRHGP